jgi:hypothetical protein
MSWVLIYIATNFLAPIPLICLGIDDFSFQFLPKSMNFSNSITNRLKPVSTPEIAGLNQKIRPQKNPNRLKPAFRLAKADSVLAKAGLPGVNASASALPGASPSRPPAITSRARATAPGHQCQPLLRSAAPPTPLDAPLGPRSAHLRAQPPQPASTARPPSSC